MFFFYKPCDGSKHSERRSVKLFCPAFHGVFRESASELPNSRRGRFASRSMLTVYQLRCHTTSALSHLSLAQPYLRSKAPGAFSGFGQNSINDLTFPRSRNAFDLPEPFGPIKRLNRLNTGKTTSCCPNERMLETDMSV